VTRAAAPDAIPTPRTAAARRRARRWQLRLAARQVGYEHRSFWRNRSRAFFSFLMPIILLVIAGSVNRGDRITERGNVAFATFFVPGILAYGIITATFANLAASLTLLRDQGVLKRMRGTPLPPWAYMVGRVGSSTLAMLELVAVTLAVGWAAFGTHVRGSTLPGLALALVAGMVCFTALGIGATTVIPNADAAQPVTTALVLPLTFISGIFFVPERLPAWLNQVAGAFPIKRLADALQFAYDPRTGGAGIAGHDLVVLALWTAAGVALMRSFRWESNRP
jgi:ABC-2 type transport system permease protein